MAFDSDVLIDAVKGNLGILKIAGAGFLVAIVIDVLLGIFLENVNNGTIATSSAANTSIQTLGTAALAAVTTIAGVFTAIAGFVLIVALLKAFGIDLSIGSGRQ